MRVKRKARSPVTGADAEASPQRHKGQPRASPHESAAPSGILLGFLLIGGEPRLQRPSNLPRELSQGAGDRKPFLHVGNLARLPLRQGCSSSGPASTGTASLPPPPRGCCFLLQPQLTDARLASLFHNSSGFASCIHSPLTLGCRPWGQGGWEPGRGARSARVWHTQSPRLHPAQARPRR